MDDWTVLLVDDEKEFASTLAERLTLRGLNVYTANSGDDALHMMTNDPADVVVLDLMMPGMSGLKVLERLRTDYPNVRVILLTGMGSVADGVKGMQMGAFDYLMKPVEIDGLIHAIREAMSKPI
ncbi:MAG: two-component system, OmpR family, response regulator CpxR [Thermodesulfobacteriota bacterium]|nr:two-component system, OmpR family, response regulator CpxR [Thermodesulfobacteriota bacterium]